MQEHFVVIAPFGVQRQVENLGQLNHFQLIVFIDYSSIPKFFDSKAQIVIFGRYPKLFEIGKENDRRRALLGVIIARLDRLGKETSPVVVHASSDITMMSHLHFNIDMIAVGQLRMNVQDDVPIAYNVLW